MPFYGPHATACTCKYTFNLCNYVIKISGFAVLKINEWNGISGCIVKSNWKLKKVLQDVST